MLPTDILSEIIRTLMSQTGIVSVILVAIIYYLQRELANERKNHASTAAKLLETSGTTIAALAASSAANQASADANARMRTILERLLDRLIGHKMLDLGNDVG